MKKQKYEENDAIFEILIYFIVFSGIYALWQGYQDFLNYVTNPETYLPFSIILVSYYLLLTVFHIYSITLLAKRKNNSIFSTKLLFFLLIMINIIQLLWIYYIKEGYEFIFWIVIWMLFYTIFVIYLYKSKEIIKKFPKGIVKKSIAVILFVVILILSSILWITLFGVQHLINKGIIQK